MISPGYAYEKAPDQDHFLHRNQTVELFRRTLAQSQARLGLQPVAPVPRVPQGELGPRVHALGQSDLQHFRLAAAVLPAAGRLLRELPRTVGHDRLVAPTAGKAATRKCRDCMVHCGYEPTAVTQTFSSLRGLAGAAPSSCSARLRDETPEKKPPAQAAPRRPAGSRIPKVRPPSDWRRPIVAPQPSAKNAPNGWVIRSGRDPLH